MKIKLDRYEVIMLACWFIWLIFFWETLTYPVLYEEIDYLRFLQFDSITNPEIWSSHFFYLIDGHPPLLSFVSSLIAHTFDSLLVMRMSILAFTFISLSYLFRWCKELKLGAGITICLAVIIYFPPIHTSIFTRAIGDLMGMGLLMGWLFHRQKDQRIKSCLCLFLSVMIRETHMLPAIFYLLLDLISKKRFTKEMLVELVPGLFLFVFFVLTKIFTGQWYGFSGKSFVSQGNLNPIVLLIYIRFAIPLVFIYFFFKGENTRYKWLAILTSIAAMFIFFPYLSVFMKSRLLTPFLSVCIVAVMMSFRYAPRKWVILFLSVWGICEFQFKPNIPKNHVREAKLISNLVNKLEVKGDAAVSGTWPFNSYLGYPGYGHWKGISGSRKFSQDFYNGKLDDFSQYFIYFTSHPDRKKMMELLCQKYPHCPIYTFQDNFGKDYTFFILGFDVEKIKETWKSLN